MNWNKVIYWISTGIMCLVFAYSAGMYIMSYEGIVAYFPKLGFPGWLVAPLAAIKILGIIAILSKQSRMLKEWAYAGFFFDAVLAYAAHHHAADGGGMISVIALVAIVISRIFDHRLYG